MFARYSVADLGSWHHLMYSLEENGDLGKPKPTPDHGPHLLTQIVANINVFADPGISSALFSRRVVRGMNTLDGPYRAPKRADAMFR
jgi:hypothetical protein